MINLNHQVENEPLDVVCVYGPQHVASIRNVLIPALAEQHLPDGYRLVLNLLNYQDNRAFLSEEGCPGLKVCDWSSARSATHIGFGEGINYLVQSAGPRRCFFLVNPDSFPMDNCLARLFTHFNLEQSVGIVEARQWPSEHPKEYDKCTMETPWASGAFSLVSADVFRLVGGFDPIYFLYNEDVDLSWKIWLAGYRIIYAKDSVATHFTGLFSYRPDRFYHEHFYSSRNFLVISYKYFGETGETRAYEYLNSYNLPSPLKRLIIESYLAIKPFIARYPGSVDSPFIKVTGFNQYHEMQTN